MSGRGRGMCEVEEIYIQLPERQTAPAASCQGRNGGTTPKRRFIRLNEAHFVNEIKKRPILYQTTMKDYKRFSHRQEAWEQVAAAMHLSQQECRKRWRSLRDAFMKVVRMKDEQERKNWIHYRLLEFLLPYVGKRGKRPRSEEFVASFENSEDGMDFIDVESDPDMYNDSDQVTVSYITEDGKEVFQVLEASRRLPAGAIAMNEFEDLDEHEETTEPDYAVVHSENEMGTEEADTGQDMYVYEEPLENLLPLIEKEDGPNAMSYGLPLLGGSDFPKVSTIDEILPMDDHKNLVHVDHRLSSDVIGCFTEEEAEAEAEAEAEIEAETEIEAEAETEEPPKIARDILHVSPVSPQTQTAPSSTSKEEPDGKGGDDDSDERFLLSCLPNLRRLSNKKNQLARLRIQQMLFELEFEEKYVYDGS